MLSLIRFLAIAFTCLAAGCSGTNGNLPESHDEHSREGGHDRDSGEHGRKGEESGVELSLDATYDKVRNGVRLVLAYEVASRSFVGTVENTTSEALKAARVEVHLSNGEELGPTPPADLAPGEKRPVRLKAENSDFTRWSAHPEVGSGEHGHEGGEEHR